jgi:hypothetical protein
MIVPFLRNSPFDCVLDDRSFRRYPGFGQPNTAHRRPPPHEHPGFHALLSLIVADHSPSLVNSHCSNRNWIGRQMAERIFDPCKTAGFQHWRRIGAQRGGKSLAIGRGKKNPSARNVFWEDLYLLWFGTGNKACPALR